MFVQVLQDQYKQLAGTLLEGIARLFTQNVRLIVYSVTAEEVQTGVQKAGLRGWRWRASDSMVSAEPAPTKTAGSPISIPAEQSIDPSGQIRGMRFIFRTA